MHNEQLQSNKNKFSIQAEKKKVKENRSGKKKHRHFLINDVKTLLWLCKIPFYFYFISFMQIIDSAEDDLKASKISNSCQRRVEENYDATRFYVKGSVF